MLELWESIYTKQHFVRVDELSMHSESFDLTEFTVSGAMQSHTAQINCIFVCSHFCN